MNDQRLVVTHYNPGQVRSRRIMLVVAFGLVLGLGYVLGSQMFGSAMGNLAELEEQSADLALQLEQSRQELNRLRLDTDVDKAALEETRKGMVDLQNQIYQRDEELKLYRDLLRDGDQPTGLSVSDVSFTRDSDGLIKYRWVARQKTNEVKSLKVHAQLWLVGTRSGEEVTIPISDMDDAVEKLPLTLDIRYFVINQGKLQLPEGFDPAKLRISLRYSWTNEPQFTREFDWTLEG